MDGFASQRRGPAVLFGSLLLVLLALTRASSAAVCTKTSLMHIGTERWTDSTDACAGGRLLVPYTQTEFALQNVTVGSENVNCRNASSVELRLVNQTIVTTELRNVSVAHTKTVCLRNETYQCGSTTVQCGTKVCGWQGCCICAEWCDVPQYCERCAENETSTTYTWELVDVSVQVNSSEWQNLTIITPECDTVPLLELQNVSTTTTSPQNCEKDLYRTIHENTTCIHGTCLDGNCICNLGWQGKACDIDVPECSVDNGGCEHACIEQAGSFECECQDGFELRNQFACSDVDECATGNGGCPFRCQNSIGGHSCLCATGFEGDGFSCQDIDECARNIDGCSQECMNTQGSFLCNCTDGFTLLDDGVTCIDINECQTGAAECTTTDGTANVFCENLNGGYSCVCGTGYTSTGPTTCTPVDCGFPPSPSFCPDGVNPLDCRPPTISCSATVYLGTCDVACPDAEFGLQSGPLARESLESSSTAVRRISCRHSGEWSSYLTSWCYRLNRPPQNITINNLRVPENFVGQIGVLGIEDDDVNDSIEWALNDTAVFEIQGSTLLLKTAQDFERGPNVIPIAVVATDSWGDSASAVFIIEIQDVNDAPSDLTLSSSKVTENSPQGTLVGLLSAVDQDKDDTHSYSLLSHQNLFQINQVNRLERSAGAINYEAAANLDLVVRATDNGNPSLSATFLVHIQVDDANDAPAGISLSNRVIDESMLVGTLIGDLQIVDEDNLVNKAYLVNRTLQTFEVSLVAPSATPVEIRGLQLFLKEQVNYETQPEFSVFVSVQDSGIPPQSSGPFKLDLFVQDSNDIPQFVRIWPQDVPENVSPPATIAHIQVFDEDLGGGSRTILLLDDADGVIGLESSSTVCNTVVANESAIFPPGLTLGQAYSLCTRPVQVLQPLDFEQQNVLNLVVRVEDGASSVIQALNLSLVDVNEAPIALTLSRNTITENSQPGTLVGELAALDPDLGDVHSFSIVSVYPEALLPALVIAGRELVTSSDSAVVLLDFESFPSFNLTVRAHDSGSPALAVEQNFHIDIQDVNERPISISIRGGNVSEAAIRGERVGLLVVEDPDNMHIDHQRHSCTILSSSNTATFAFQFVGGTELVVREPILDYEQQQFTDLSVTCMDDGLPSLGVTTTLRINILDANEAPQAIALSGLQVPENAPAQTVVGQLGILDPDTSDVHHLEILLDDSSDLFRLRDNQLVTAVPLNFEDGALHVVSIRATDRGGLFTEETFLISVLDANDLPAAPLLSGSRVISEQALRGSLVGRFDVLDEDASQTHSFELVDLLQTDAAYFRIEGDGLYLSAAAPDFERVRKLHIRVKATDNGTPTTRFSLSDFDFEVSDVNEAPTAIRLEPIERNDSLSLPMCPGGVALMENSLPRTKVVQISVDDPDNLYFLENGTITSTRQTFTCVVEGFESRFFRVTENLELYVVHSPDYEQITNGQVQLTCIDSGSPVLAITATFPFCVGNVNEPPSMLLLDGRSINAGTQEMAEMLVPGSPIGVLSVIDPDNCDATHCQPPQHFSLELTGTPYLALDGEMLVVGQSVDFEVVSVISARITVTDSGSPPRASEFVLRVEVLDQNDPPTELRFSSLLAGNDCVPENSTVGSYIGIIKPIDQDRASAQITAYEFSLQAGAVDDREKFRVLPDGLIQLTTVLNFEDSDMLVLQLDVTDRFLEPLTIQLSLQIAVCDANDAPTLQLIPEHFSVAETAAPGAILANVIVHDEDVGDRISCVVSSVEQCSLDGHNCVLCASDCDSSWFKLESNQEDAMQWRLLTAHTLNYESSPAFRVTIQCFDGSGVDALSSNGTFFLEIEDRNDGPSVPSFQPSTLVSLNTGAYHFQESVPLPAVLGHLVASDEDADSILAFRLVSAPSGMQLAVTSGGAVLITSKPRILGVALSATFAVEDNNGATALSVPLLLVADNVNDAPQSIDLFCGCSSISCLNGGHCILEDLSPAGVRCECNGGFRGASCEIGRDGSIAALPAHNNEPCLRMAPDLVPGQILARVLVRDPDAGDRHTIEALPAGMSPVEVVDGSTLVVSNAFQRLSAEDFAKPLDVHLRATDREGLTLEVEYQLKAHPCAGNRLGCDDNAVCQLLNSTDVDDLAGAECKCAAGYTGNGTMCTCTDQSICGRTACEPNPCENDGFCVETGDDSVFECDCPEGFSGTFCEILISSLCEEGLCSNGGTCLSGLERGQVAATCLCPAGFAGARCETSWSDCEDADCPELTRCIPHMSDSRSASVVCAPLSTVLVLQFPRDADACVEMLSGFAIRECSGAWISPASEFEDVVVAALFATAHINASSQVVRVAFVGSGATSRTIYELVAFDRRSATLLDPLVIHTALVEHCDSLLEVPSSSTQALGYCSFERGDQPDLASTEAPSFGPQASTNTGQAPVWIPVLTVILILLAVLGAGWWFYRQRRTGRVVVLTPAKFRSGHAHTGLDNSAVWKTPSRDSTISGEIGGRIGSMRQGTVAWDASFADPELSAIDEDDGYIQISAEEENARTLRRKTSIRFDNPLFSADHQSRPSGPGEVGDNN
eukprot:m.124425 g.124425  ORF g.124425 m.124425 type:complete len:2539 (-) comp9672_c1_seq2:155-7771(-)